MLGSGVEFYSGATGDVCMRNDHYALYTGEDVRPYFNAGVSCTAPLSSGPAYGNNPFGNADGACGGEGCSGCGCVPSGSFWEYSVNPYWSMAPTT